MKCPFCGAPEEKIILLGHKRHFDHGNYRDYVCISCEQKFDTIEEFNMRLESTKNTLDLFNVRRATGQA